MEGIGFDPNLLRQKLLDGELKSERKNKTLSYFQVYEKEVSASGVAVLKLVMPNDKSTWKRKKDLIVSYEISYQIKNLDTSWVYKQLLNDLKNEKIEKDEKNGKDHNPFFSMGREIRRAPVIDEWVRNKARPNRYVGYVVASTKSTEIKTTLWTKKWIDPKNKKPHNPHEIELSFQTDEDLLIAVHRGFVLAKAAGYRFVDISDVIDKKANNNEGLGKVLLDICFDFSLKLNLAGIMWKGNKFTQRDQLKLLANSPHRNSSRMNRFN